MALDQRKYERKHTDVLRDIRPMYTRLGDWFKRPNNAFTVFIMGAAGVYFSPSVTAMGDLILIVYLIYFWWLAKQKRKLVFKMPLGARYPDYNAGRDGKPGTAGGVLYLGNVDKTKEEVWFSDSDARTHILYLGTTGSGKTTGLKSMVSNALAWGSGFVYIDGKADTDLWSSLSSLVRRFGRDDDLLVLNYMTGNSDVRAPSNTMNPFSSGSASYLTNMLVSLMPESGGDNAMWKERAVSLVSSIMPALTWKRDNQDIPTSVTSIRNYLSLNNVVKLSRDAALPAELKFSLKSYLDTLPGYIDAAFDDDGKEKPPGPNSPAYDTTTPRQQHGYLAMQFTRSLQSLGDDYGYIFDTQAADVDMVDVVLNRRILIVLIPALEKSSDETANLGKIVASTIKGMMGSTLGATVEGESSKVIENKPTNSSTPFMCVFDEVGYYAAQGMAVMAAQARSLGFCLVFSAQDLPAMEKRVKEEARSITANCNIKIFGKLEDPTQTKEFFEKTVGSAIVTEVSGYQLRGGHGTGSYFDTQQAGVQLRPRASYDGLRAFKEGQAVIAFGEMVVDTGIFYANTGFAKAMRVQRFVALPPPDETLIKNASAITKVRDLMVHKTWTAMKADVAVEAPPEIDALQKTFKIAEKAGKSGIEAGMAALVGIYALNNEIPEDTGDSAPMTPPVSSAPSTPVALSFTTPPQQNAAPAAQGGSPLAKFAAPKTPQQEGAQPPAQPAQPAATPPPSAATSGSPMGFFTAKKPDGAAAETLPVAPIAAAPVTPTVAPPVVQQSVQQTPAEPPRAPLDPAANKTLQDAGKALRESLFGEKGDGDDKGKK
jgi:intracellular multiplication protein IcmO